MKRYFVRITNGSKSNGLLELRLRDHEVPVVQQQAVRPQDELVRARLGIDARTQVDAEILDRRPGLRVDDAAIERLFGDVEVRLEQQGREGSVSWLFTNPSRETASGGSTSVRSSSSSKQLAERVAILRDGQPPHPAVLGRRPRPCQLQRLRDPFVHPLVARRPSAAVRPPAAWPRSRSACGRPPTASGAGPRAPRSR